jgi:transposase
MTESNFYSELLGLDKPWEVESVTLDKDNLEVLVKVRCKQTVWACPETRERVHVHGWNTRRWRHLDTCQFKTIIEASVPRLKYPDGRTASLDVPWAQDSSRFTALFERLAIELMLCCSIKEAASILKISWDEADGIKARAVRRGLARRDAVSLERICVDEKSYQKGHKYITCVARIGEDGKARVHYVGDGKGSDALDGFFDELPEGRAREIKAACVDMSKALLSSLKSNLPGWEGKVVHDRFHLVQHMNNAVNETRKQEHAALSKKKDERLKGTRQLWLHAEENLTDWHLERFEAMKDVTLKTGRAWSIKEVFREFLACSSRSEAAECFKLWHQWAIRSRLPAVERVARMFKKHLAQILNYFDHRITNGPIEGLNARIQGLIKKAFGYRNKERLKSDIFFHLGDLDLYPSNESTAS